MARRLATDKYFSQPYYFDKEELKKEYRLLSKKHHPDVGGNSEVMAAINSEYEALKNEPLGHQAKQKRKYAKSDPVWHMQEIVNLLLDWGIDCNIDDGVIIADKGSRTYEMREELKKVGFWWDPLNKYWYWELSHSKRKTS